MNVTIIRPCWIWVPEEVETYRRLVERPEEWVSCLWAYIHVEDVARAFEAALAAEWPSGCEEFFITAPDNGTRYKTQELIARFLPEVTDIRAPLQDRAPLISTAKAEKLLGWRAERNWQEML